MRLWVRLRHPAWVVALLVATIAAVGVPAAAGPHDRLQDIESRREHIARRQARLALKEDTLAVVVGRLDADRARADARLSELDGKLGELDRRIGGVEVRLSREQAKLALLTEELLDVQKDLVARTDSFTDRAVAAYKAGPSAAIDGLLSSESFSDLVDRLAYYEAALNQDSYLVEEIEVLRDATEARRAAVELTKDQIAAAKLALEQDRTAVASLRAEQAQVVAQREQAVAAKAAVLRGVRNDRARLAEMERELRAESARIESLLAAASSGSGPFPSGGGQLLWPAAGPLTSGYGPRVHPILGGTRMHTGIDIAAPYGAPVIAADSGTVVFAGSLGGYGNSIAIDHGGGLATTYNHLSGFSVSSGASVRRGGRIGSVGCSGYCTGPHLHFEVRINGSPVDPMPYLQ